MAASVVAACDPQPRAVSYFEAHPDVADKVIAECASGARRGAECNNALDGKARNAIDARMAFYRKGF
jgi:hypothetical protein